MITRITLTSESTSRNAVRDELLTAIEQIKLFAGGEWTERAPGIIIGVDGSKFYANVTIVRTAR